MTVVAIVVGINILVTGYRLVSESIRSLLDAALPEQDMATLGTVLDTFRTDEVDFGRRRTGPCEHFPACLQGKV